MFIPIIDIVVICAVYVAGKVSNFYDCGLRQATVDERGAAISTRNGRIAMLKRTADCLRDTNEVLCGCWYTVNPSHTKIYI